MVVGCVLLSRFGRHMTPSLTSTLLVGHCSSSVSERMDVAIATTTMLRKGCGMLSCCLALAGTRPLKVFVSAVDAGVRLSWESPLAVECCEVATCGDDICGSSVVVVLVAVLWQTLDSTHRRCGGDIANGLEMAAHTRVLGEGLL